MATVPDGYSLRRFSEEAGVCEGDLAGVREVLVEGPSGPAAPPGAHDRHGLRDHEVVDEVPLARLLSDAKEAGLLQARLSLAGATMGTVDVLLAGMARARWEALVTGDRDFSAVRRDVRLRSYARSRA